MTSTGEQNLPIKYSNKLLAFILAIVAFAVYANTLGNGYALDDATVITNNTIVQQGFAGIPELLTTPRLKGFEQGTDAESYRPVPMVTHAIEYQLFEAKPAPGHLVNVLLFACCAMALFVFLSKLFDDKKTGIAFMAALLFAVHPIHTEVVANIKSRDELLCFLFGMLSLGQFIRYVKNGRVLPLLTGALLLLLSYLSKETVIAFVAIVPLVFFGYVNENRKRSVIVTAATLLCTGIFLATRSAVLGSGHGNAVVFISNPLLNAGMVTRLATGILCIGMYIKLLLLPYPLISDYSYNTIPVVGFGNIWALLSLLVCLAVVITVVLRLLKHKKDVWALAGAFFLCTIALFSNIPFLVYSQFAERFSFLASVGGCLALVLVIGRLVAKANYAQIDRKALISTGIIAALFAGLTIMRNTDWKDNYTLFTADVPKAPSNAKLQFLLGTHLSQNMLASEVDPAKRAPLEAQAFAHLEKAVAIYPDFGEAHAEIGRMYDDKGMFDSSLKYSGKAVALNPANAIATYNLGRAYYAQKRYPEAIATLRKAVDMQPNYIYSYLNLARCFLEYKQYDSAIVYFDRALAMEPQNGYARDGMNKAMRMKTQTDSTQKRP